MLPPDSPSLDPRPAWRDAAWVALVVAVGWLGSTLLFQAQREAEAQREAVRVAAATEAVQGRIEQLMARTVESVRSAGSMVEVQPELPRAAFMRYAAQLATSLPALGMLEWQPLVPGPARAEFERRARAQGLVDFEIREPAADGSNWVPAPARDRYVPILYGWPEGKAPLGFNLAPDPVRMASKDEAARQGRPLASGSFPILRQDIGAPAIHGFAITAPVMEPVPGPSGRIGPRGFLAAVIELPALFVPVQGEAARARVDFWVFEGAKPEGLLLHASVPEAPAAAGRAAALQRVSTVDVAGQPWTLLMQPQAALLGQERQALPWVVLALGLFTSALAGGALHHALRERRRTQAAQATLERERERLSNVLEGTRAAIWEADLRTGVTHVNEQWHRLAGYEPNEHPIGPGYDWREDCHPDDIPLVEEALRRHFRGETEAYEAEYRHRHKTQGWIWVHARAKALSRDAEGRVRRIAGMLLDIQARKEAEARILELNASLEARVDARTAELRLALASLHESREALARAEARAALDALVANVSQELTTPLGNSAIAVQNLVDRSAEFQHRLDGAPLRRSELSGFVDQVQANAMLAQRNLVRANHLLDTFSRLASAPGDGPGEARREIDLAEWLRTLLDTLDATSPLRPHRVALDVPEGLRLTTAPGLLGLVVSQLLQHLARHAFPEGSVGTLRLSAQIQDDQLRLSFADDGPGLPPEAQSGSLGPLRRRSGSDGGAPLGMAIADQLLRQDLGGSLRVVGLPGPGPRFELRLPLRPPPPASA